MTTEDYILSKLPYSKPFRFVDRILEVNENYIKGSFHLTADMSFYSGHFPQHPITPGVILTEIMAQIGLASLGIYLNKNTVSASDLPFVMTATQLEFLKPVYPDTTVFVESEKVYFRFGKLKCKVTLKDKMNETLCEGFISGIQIKQ